MASIVRPTLNRIPGGGMPLAKKESYAKDLTKLSQLELQEIKQREEKLLQNKSKLGKLPDKGKRIQDFYEKVLLELERRSNVNDAAKMFSNLNITTQGEKTLNELEWQGNLNKMQENMNPLEDVLDSDDETELDPLKIIAQRQMHERKVKVHKPEVKLITEEDIKEIESFTIDKEELDETRSHSSGSHTIDLETHVYYLVDKTETNVAANREKFKPHRTTVSNVHDPNKERQRKQGKHWEVTAATPPPIQHNGTQLLPLINSVEIQAQYLLKIKELQEKQAADRLAAKVKRLEARKIALPSEEELQTKTSFTKYRNTKSPTHIIEGVQKLNEDDEVYDPLDEEKPGGVKYNVFE